jgi:hypothetical protein
MATDRNLIAGAARLADAESAMSIGIGAGLAKEALRIQQDIVQKTNERRSILRQDMNNAATFIGRMQTLDNVTGQYHDVLTERGIYTRDELNRIAEDTSLSSAQKIAEYSRLTNEYNALASNFTRDQQKLIGLQNSVAQGLTSETLNFSDPDVAIARQLGTGEYEITKDGYNVTYDIDGKKSTVLVKSQELDKYISKYSIKDLEGLTTLQDNYVKEIANAKGDTQLEGIIQKRFELLPVEDKLKLLVDLEGNSYINYINKETNELNVDHINAEFKKYAAKLTDEFGYTPTPEEKKSLFVQDLENTSTKIVNNLMNGDFQDFKNVVGPNGYNIEEIVVESAKGLADLKSRGYNVDGYEDQINRVRIMTTVNGKPQINYYDNDDDLIKDLIRGKLLETAEGQEERKEARNQSILAFNNYKNQQIDIFQDTIEKIKLELKNNGNDFNKLNDAQKATVRLLPGQFSDVKIEEEKSEEDINFANKEIIRKYEAQGGEKKSTDYIRNNRDKMPDNYPYDAYGQSEIIEKNLGPAFSFALSRGTKNAQLKAQVKIINNLTGLSEGKGGDKEKFEKYIKIKRKNSIEASPDLLNKAINNIEEKTRGLTPEESRNLRNKGILPADILEKIYNDGDIFQPKGVGEGAFVIENLIMHNIAITKYNELVPSENQTSIEEEGLNVD